MPELTKNFAVSTVTTAPVPATSGVTLVIVSGESTRFPAAPFNATVAPSGVQPTPLNAEVVRVTNIAGNTFTIARAREDSTARAIAVGDTIFAGVTAKTLSDLEDVGFIRLRTHGSAGDGTTDDANALQATFDANRAANLWMDGEGLTYVTTQPLVLGPSQKLRHVVLKARSGYGPTATPMLMNAQGPALAFTASGPTDVFTTVSPHGLPADDTTVLFKGTVPAGVLANTVYYVRDRTTSTFKVAATPGGAAVNLTSDGDGTVYVEVQSLQKVYLDDVYINGNSLAENGATLYLQQQSILRKLRIDNCTGIGLHLAGQQAVIENFEAISNGTGLALDNASFMYFHGFNIENSTTGVYVWDATGPFGGGAFSCLFSGVHLEQNGIAGAVAFDLGGPHDQLVFDNVSASMNLNGQIVLYQYSGDVASSGYTLRNVRVIAGGSTARPTMVQDDNRSITLDSWDDFRFRLEEFHAPRKPTSDSYTDPAPVSIVLPAGGYIRSGSTTGTVPKLDFRPSTGQTADQTVWRNTGGAAITMVGVDGKVTAPSLKVTGGTPGSGKVLTSDGSGNATWAAVPGGSAHASTHVDGGADELVAPLDPATFPLGLRLDSYKSAQYYPACLTVHGGLAGTGVPTLDRATFTLFVVWASTTFDRIAVYTTTNGSAGAVMRLGIYNDGVGVPGTVLLDAGTIATDTGANSIRAITISQVLAPGRYWACAAPQVAASGACQRMIPLGFGQFMSAGFNGSAIYFDGMSGALSANPSVASAALNPPLVGLRAA